jgi:hypothetical protein
MALTLRKTGYMAMAVKGRQLRIMLTMRLKDMLSLHPLKAFFFSFVGSAMYWTPDSMLHP